MRLELQLMDGKVYKFAGGISMVDLNGHSKRVSELCVLIGNEMGLSKERIKDLKISGLFHDIGKYCIDEQILNKKDKLTNGEFELLKLHAIFSGDIVKKKGMNKTVIEAVTYHHERFDGNGYNKGLKGTEIPLYSRIIAIADSYDAMTNDRPYSTAICHKVAMQEIRNNSGTQYDPLIVKFFEITMKNKHNYDSRKCL